MAAKLNDGGDDGLQPPIQRNIVTMRQVFALLAVMALLISPVTAAAAQAACGHGRTMAMTRVMANMDGSAMSAPGRAGARRVTADPCCDHAGRGAMSHRLCAQICAGSCAAALALPGSLASLDPAFARARAHPARLAPVEGHEPAGLDRPPKPIA